MIVAYHRPKTLDEALTLLDQPNRVPLGGGTLLAHVSDTVEAVDLQALGIDTIAKAGSDLTLGATVTLQTLLENADCPAGVKTALKLEAPLNLRNMATVAGTLVSADGRSPFATALLALDAKVSVMVNRQPSVFNLGEFLLARPQGLVTQIALPLNVKFAFEYVSKTPSDKPLVCAALTQWNSGRARLTLGGYGKTPQLALDGTEAEGLDSAARNAYHEAHDEWASTEYRMDVAATLAKRCLASLI